MAQTPPIDQVTTHDDRTTPRSHRTRTDPWTTDGPDHSLAEYTDA